MGCCSLPVRRCRERPQWRSLNCAVTLLVCALGSPAFAAEPVRLTTDGLTKFGAVFCKGGEELIYVDFVQGATYRLQRLNLQTGKVELQHPKATSSEFEAIPTGSVCLPMTAVGAV